MPRKKSSTGANPRSIKPDFLTERVNLEKSPFTAVKIQDRWHLVCGRYRLKANFDSLEELKKYVYIFDWEMILVAIQAICEQNIKDKLNTK